MPNHLKQFLNATENIHKLLIILKIQTIHKFFLMILKILKTFADFSFNL